VGFRAYDRGRGGVPIVLDIHVGTKVVIFNRMKVLEVSETVVVALGDVGTEGTGP